MKKAISGDKGDKGDKGDTGVGISKLEVIDGALYVTLTNNVKENAGVILTDEVKSWLVSQITDNAESNFNEYYNSKVTEFNNNATEKTTAYNNNAEDKLSEYNTNATNKISEYNSNAEAILKLLPNKTTEIQETIDVDDSAESSFNKLSVFGNSRQESTTGANKAIGNTYLNNSQYGDSLYLIGDIKPDTTYTVNLFVPNGNAYYLAEELIVGYKSLVGYGEYETISFTTKSDISSAIKGDKGFVFLKNLIVNPEENDFKNIMLVEGEFTDENMPLYEPYTGGNPSPNPDYPQKIESIKDSITFKKINANLLDISDLYTEATINGVNIKYNNDGTLTLNGTATEQIRLALGTGGNLKNGDYSFKNFGSPSNIATNIYYIGDVYGETVRSFTITEEHNYVIVYVIPLNTTINATIKPMLVKGKYDDNTFPEFQQYKEENYILPVQQNMYALVEGQEDCFVKKDDGKWYERHYSFEGELTGEEVYSINAGRFSLFNTNNYGFSTAVYNKNTNQLCNYFAFSKDWIVGDRYFICSVNAIYFPMFLDTLEEMKAFVKQKYNEGNPIKVVYIRSSGDRDTPTYLDLECTPEQTAVLNQLEQFSLSKGINHIYSDDELSPKFQLKYYQDMNILLDKINKNIADVSAQLL